MKIHRFAAFAATLTSSAFAQTNTFPPSGNVGIGTTAPNARLEVVKGTSGDGGIIAAFGTLGAQRIQFFDELNSSQGPKIYSNAGYPFIIAGAGHVILQPGGNVGIGMTSPQQKLAVNGYIDAQGFLPVTNFLIRTNPNDTQTFQTQGSLGKWVFTNTDGGGFLGIGTPNPGAKLSVHAGNLETVVGSILDLSNQSGSAANHVQLVTRLLRTSTHNGWESAALQLVRRTDVTDQASISLVGDNVGIGTTSPTHKLAVNGTIKAKEVIVETTGWSDYVFADNYTLAPLAEVEAHIKEHKHLPGIPSATQVAEQGVSIGDMQARLLAKVEELTLYVIDLKKDNAELQERIKALEATP